ncbi:hypothetical protein MTR67_032587 [Solanum verrucosum]|uniref:Uncharacterized protein n=1 Tax=Solanum verrucosum TaxID=315347 RepID=A0AAF0U4I4_SOLVR|nr:hypothetical protein MTR67_032587 [Solanum verrucosum]
MRSQVQIPVEAKKLGDFFSSVQALVDKVTWYSDGEMKMYAKQRSFIFNEDRLSRLPVPDAIPHPYSLLIAIKSCCQHNGLPREENIPPNNWGQKSQAMFLVNLLTMNFSIQEIEYQYIYGLEGVWCWILSLMPQVLASGNTSCTVCNQCFNAFVTYLVVVRTSPS